MNLKELIALSGLYGGAAAALRVVGAAVFLWLARALSVDDYATFGLLYALQQALATFALAGIVEAVIGQLRKERHGVELNRLFANASSAFLSMSLVSVFVAIVCWITWFRSPGSSPLLIVSVIVGGVVLAWSSLRAQLTRLGEDHWASVSFNTFPTLFGLVCAVLAFAARPAVDAYFSGFAIGALLSLLYVEFRRSSRPGFSGRPSEIRIILVGAIPFVAASFLGWLSGYGNNYVLAFLFERSEIAKFTFLLAISSVMQLVASALNQVWSPRFYKLAHQLSPAEIEKGNRSFFRLQGVVLGLVGGLVLALIPTGTTLIGGNLIAYQSMEVESLCLFSSYVVLGPWWHCYNYYLVHDEGRALMVIVLVTSAVGLALWIGLMWLLGPIGIYLGFLVQMMVRTCAIVIAARRKWPITIAWDGVVAGVLLALGGFAIGMV